MLLESQFLHLIMYTVQSNYNWKMHLCMQHTHVLLFAPEQTLKTQGPSARGVFFCILCITEAAGSRPRGSLVRTVHWDEGKRKSKE